MLVLFDLCSTIYQFHVSTDSSLNYCRKNALSETRDNLPQEFVVVVVVDDVFFFVFCFFLLFFIEI